MTKPFKQWKVLPHGKLKQIDDNILTVTGDIHMPLMDLHDRGAPERVTAGGFQRHRVDDDEMAELERTAVRRT
jgi:hypothetical protein